jgi:hypothetical protein
VNGDHEHDGFEIPLDYVDPAGRAVDHLLLGDFVGAVVAGCRSCRDALLTFVAEHPPTTARLVELACISTRELLGGLPATMTEEHAGGPIGLEFRRLAGTGVDGANSAMFSACERLSSADRRAAADTAAGILVAQLRLGLSH